MEPPARSAVAVAALPLGADVEIEAIAVIGSSGGNNYGSEAPAQEEDKSDEEKKEDWEKTFWLIAIGQKKSDECKKCITKDNTVPLSTKIYIAKKCRFPKTNKV